MNDDLIRMEEVLEKYTTWLNMWAKHSDPNDPSVLIDRSSYDEWDDPPKILHVAGVPEADYLVMVIYANPYHDEGGPTILTAHFRLDPQPGGGRAMELVSILQDFDTMIQPIYSPTLIKVHKEVDDRGYINTPR